jgi:hypothetical protein
MVRLSAFPALLALATAAALTLSACGEGSSPKLLPGATASQIDANLSQVELLVGEGECIGAQNSAGEIESQVEELTGVDPKLRQALAEGATRLNENVAAECEEASEEEEPTIEENEAAEPTEKPKREKPEKQAEEEKPAEAGEGPTLPPQPNGKGEEEGHSEEAPPAETGGGPEPPSGGVGPGAPVEGE